MLIVVVNWSTIITKRIIRVRGLPTKYIIYNTWGNKNTNKDAYDNG